MRLRSRQHQQLPTLVVILIIIVLTTADVHPVGAAGFSMVHISAPIRYGGNSTNAEMVAYHGSIYVAYADEDFTLTVARRDAATGEWTKATQIDTTIGEEDSSHNQITMAIDGVGYIHVWYGMHDRQGMRYARSNSPGKVTDGFTIRSGEIPNAGESYTYPHAASAPNGDIYFSVRREGRKLPLFHWDNQLKQWQEIAVFVDGTATKNKGQTYTPYLPWLFVDSSNNVHIKWDWAYGTARSERHNGSYALYRPETGHFYRADGTEYTLPITTSTVDIFQPKPENVTWDDEGIALSDMVVDSNQYPVISYAFSPDGTADHWEHRVARWNGSQWVQTTLTNQTKKWNKNFLLLDANTIYYYARTASGTERWTLAADSDVWSGALVIYPRAIDGAVMNLPYSHVLLHLSGSNNREPSELSYLAYDILSSSKLTRFS